MKKFAPLIFIFLIIFIFAGCGGDVFYTTLPGSDVTLGFTLPENYTCKETTEQEGVVLTFYKSKSSADSGTNSWSMMLSLGESSTQMYNQYIKMVSSGGGVKSANKFGDSVLFSFSEGSALGNQRGVRLIDDKYLAVLSAQGHVDQQDIISLLNSIKIG